MVSYSLRTPLLVCSEMTRKLKPPRREKTIQVGLRLPQSVVEQIDTYAEALRSETGLLGVTRTDAATALLVKGLAATRRTRRRTGRTRGEG
jgi:hypothetical protein